MQSFELTKPANSNALLQQFESRFGQTMRLEGLTLENLEDLANGVRTKIHTITDNLHFGRELQSNIKKSNSTNQSQAGKRTSIESR
jgi:hypothetical protein